MRWALAASVRHTDAGAAAFLPARVGVAREGRPSWLRSASGGRSDREGSSLDAVSDARGGIMSELPLDAAGRRRSPVTLPHFHAGRPPRNKGIRYPADPPTVEEITAVMRDAGDAVHGRRLRGLIVVLWRAGLRICEGLALTEADLDSRRGIAAGAPRQGRPPPRGRHGRLGVGAARAVARGARRAARRTAVLRGQRSDPWTAMVGLRGALGASVRGSGRRRAAALRAASAAACPCR
jgi:integrase